MDKKLPSDREAAKAARKALESARIALGFDKTEMAKALGISRRTYYGYMALRTKKVDSGLVTKAAKLQRRASEGK